MPSTELDFWTPRWVRHGFFSQGSHNIRVVGEMHINFCRRAGYGLIEDSKSSVQKQPAVFNGAGLYEPSQRKFYLNGFLKEVWPFWMDCVGIGGIIFLPVLWRMACANKWKVKANMVCWEMLAGMAVMWNIKGNLRKWGCREKQDHTERAFILC